MKTKYTIEGAIPALLYIAWFTIVILFSLGMLGLSIYGVILAFSASVMLGIIALFVQPAPLVFGVAQFFFHVNIPQMIVAWFSAHGG